MIFDSEIGKLVKQQLRKTTFSIVFYIFLTAFVKRLHQHSFFYVILHKNEYVNFPDYANAIISIIRHIPNRIWRRFF